jgi:tetratricopeptide (TPR) repeat protein
VMPLTGLGTGWGTPEEALQTAGVQLFLNAARRSQPGLTLGPDNLEPVSEILRLTDGMPLGIVLAAAWVDMLSIADIAAEIGKSLDFLETSATDAPDRHRSIRAVFDYTWRLLDTDEQQVFAALSVFRGGFTRDAAEAVAGASLRDLANLAGKSLVTPNPDSGRYSFHELLRQYAEEELEKDSTRFEAVRQAHADFYGNLVSAAFALFPAGEQRQMMTTIDQDMENIRVAWRHYLAMRNPSGVLKMIGGLWAFFESSGWYQASLTLAGEAVDTFENTEDPVAVVARSYVLAVHGANLVLVGQSDVGLAAGDRAVEGMRRYGTSEGLFFSLYMKAQSLLYLSRPADASVFADEALALGDEPDARWGQRLFWAAGLKNLRAFAALVTGDVPHAVELLRESASVLEPVGDLYYMTWNLGHQARVALGDGRREDALELFRQSADRARELGFLRGMQVSLAAFGDISLATGRLEDAEAAFIEALDAASRTRMVPEMLGAMVSIATAFAASRRGREAVELLATVVAEPASSRQLFTKTTPINAMAAAELDKLRTQLDPAEYEAAHAAGSSRPYGVAAKELVASI